MCSELPLCTAFPKAICNQAHSDTSKLKTSSWLLKWQGTPTSHLQEHTPQKLHHPGQHHSHGLPLPALLGRRQRAPMAASPLCSLSIWAHAWSKLAGASPGESQQTQALLLIQLWARSPSLAAMKQQWPTGSQINLVISPSFCQVPLGKVTSYVFSSNFFFFLRNGNSLQIFTNIFLLLCC